MVFCSLCCFFSYLDLVYIGNLYLVREQTYLHFCSCQISLFTHSLVVVLECFLVVRRQKAGDFSVFFFHTVQIALKCHHFSFDFHLEDKK